MRRPSPLIHVYMKNKNRTDVMLAAIEKAINQGTIQEEHQVNINKDATKKTVRCKQQRGPMKFKCSFQLVFYFNQ